MEHENLNTPQKTPLQQTAVIGSSLQEKYDALVKEITRLQEKYDENGYDYPPMLKLQRIEAHVDMTIDILSNNLFGHFKTSEMKPKPYTNFDIKFDVEKNGSSKESKTNNKPTTKTP